MTFLYLLLQVAGVTINTVSIVVLVVAIIIMVYTIYTVRTNGTVELIHDQQEIQARFSEMRKELTRELADKTNESVKYQNELSYVRALLVDMEKRADQQDIMFADLRAKMQSQDNKIETLVQEREQERKEKERELREKHQAYEVIHMIYGMLDDAIKTIKALKAEPPQIPDDFYKFYDENVRDLFDDKGD